MLVKVVGCGVVGLSAACEMLKNGMKVEIIDRKIDYSLSASYLAGCLLIPEIEKEDADEKIMQMSIGATDWWSSFSSDLLRYSGVLVMAEQRYVAELENFSRKVKVGSRIDSDHLARLEPDLPNPHLFRSIFFSDGVFMRSIDALNVLKEYILKSGGLITEAEDLHYQDKMFDIEVDARGVHARDSVPGLRAVKGEIIVVNTRDFVFNRPIILLHPKFSTRIIPLGDGDFYIGATSIERSDLSGATVRSILDLLCGARTVHPAFCEAEIKLIKSAARPAFVDNVPKVFRKGKRIFANGVYRHGFLLAGAISAMVVKEAQEFLKEI